jgi:hypothetical protein
MEELCAEVESGCDAIHFPLKPEQEPALKQLSEAFGAQTVLARGVKGAQRRTASRAADTARVEHRKLRAIALTAVDDRSGHAQNALKKQLAVVRENGESLAGAASDSPANRISATGRALENALQELRLVDVGCGMWDGMWCTDMCVCVCVCVCGRT